MNTLKLNDLQDSDILSHCELKTSKQIKTHAVD